MAMFLIVMVRNDSRKYFFTKNIFYIHMTSGAETVHLTLTGTGGGGGENASPITVFLKWLRKRPADHAVILHS